LDLHPSQIGYAGIRRHKKLFMKKAGYGDKTKSKNINLAQVCAIDACLMVVRYRRVPLLSDCRDVERRGKGD